MARITRAYVSTPLGQIHVRQGGAGKPVILLPNTYLGSDAFMRNGFLESMANHYRVFAIDAIGQGLSDLPPRALEVADYAQSLADTMTGLGLEKAHIVGSHTGASVGLELAAGHPDRVETLIFAGLPMWNAKEREALKKAQRFVPWSITADGSYLEDLWKRRLPITHGLTPEQMQGQFMQFFIPGPRVHEPLHSLFRWEPRDRLPLVKCPLLVLASEKDAFKDQMHEIVDIIPSAKTGILKAGTLVHALDAPSFQAAILGFIG